MTDQNPSKPSSLPISFLQAFLGAGLLAYLIAGTTARYLQDDYCYAAILRGNFWERQLTSYLQEVTYSANRYSLTLGMGATELLGPGNVRVLPALILVLWVLGTFLLIRELLLITNSSRQNSLAWLGALIIPFLSLALTPNWIQVFFWRPGMFPYTAPLVSGTFLFWLIVRSVRLGRVTILAGIGIFLLAVLTGGFSETAAAAMITVIGLILLAALVRKKFTRLVLVPVLLALFGALTSLALLVFSPSTALRLQSLYGTHAPWSEVILNSLKGGLKFFGSMLYNRPLYISSAILFSLALGMPLGTLIPTLSDRKTAAWLFFSGLFTYLIVVASMAPSYYAESSYPGDRALNIPVFFSVLLILVWGIILSRWLGEKLTQIWPALIAAASFVLAAIWIATGGQYWTPPFLPTIYHFPEQAPLWYWVTLIIGIASIALLGWKNRSALLLTLSAALIIGCTAGHIALQVPVLSFRASQWDLRDAQIRADAAAGQKDVTVRALDSLVGIAEISINDDHWVNHCAAAFYRIDSITAVEPVLDPIRIEVP